MDKLDIAKIETTPTCLKTSDIDKMQIELKLRKFNDTVDNDVVKKALYNK